MYNEFYICLKEQNKKSQNILVFLIYSFYSGLIPSFTFWLSSVICK